MEFIEKLLINVEKEYKDYAQTQKFGHSLLGDGRVANLPRLRRAGRPSLRKGEKRVNAKCHESEDWMTWVFYLKSIVIYSQAPKPAEAGA